MKIENVHSRVIKQPKYKVSEILNSLATDKDLIWPFENWPRMRFKEGVKIGSIGGHKPIKYSIIKYEKSELIEFKFISPKGFNGIHKFEVKKVGESKTKLVHTIDMEVNGLALLNWAFAIKPLHNALLEDSLDKVENNFAVEKKVTNWNIWVRFLRYTFSKKK